MRFWMVGFLAAGLTLNLGCGDSADSSHGDSGHGDHEGSHSHDDHGHDDHGHGHDHGHSHNHDTGPHGGHMIEVGDEEYHVEWAHDEAGKITFYLLDAAMKEAVTTAKNTLKLDVTIEGKDPQSFEAVAVAEEGATEFSQFEIKSPELMSFLAISEGVAVKLHLNLGGKDYAVDVQHKH